MLHHLMLGCFAQIFREIHLILVKLVSYIEFGFESNNAVEVDGTNVDLA